MRKIFLVVFILLFISVPLFPVLASEVSVQGTQYTFRATHVNSLDRCVWDMAAWYDKRAYVTGDFIYFYNGDTLVWYKSGSDNPTGRRAFYHQVTFGYSQSDLWLVRTDFSSGVYTAVLERRAANAGAYVDGTQVASAGESFARRLKLIRLSSGDPAVLIRSIDGRSYHFYRYGLVGGGIVRTATITYVDGNTPYVPVDAARGVYYKLHILAVEGISTVTLASSPAKAVVLLWDIDSGDIDKLYSISLPAGWKIEEGQILYNSGVWVALGVSVPGGDGTRIILYHPVLGGALEEWWISQPDFESFQLGTFGDGSAYIVGRRNDGSSLLILARSDGGKEISIYDGISPFKVLDAVGAGGANYVADWYGGRNIYHVMLDSPVGSGTFHLFGDYPDDAVGCSVTYFDRVTVSYDLDFTERYVAIGVDEPLDLHYVETKTGTVELDLSQITGSATVNAGVYDSLPDVMGGFYVGNLDIPLGCIYRRPVPLASLDITTSAVTQDGDVELRLSFGDGSGNTVPVYGASAVLSVNGDVVGTYPIPDGTATYALPSINLPEPGVYQISASVAFAMGGYKTTVSAGTATVEYVNLFRPTLDLPEVVSGTVVLTGTAPVGTIYVVVDGATLTHVDHPVSGPYSIDVDLSLGHHKIYTVVEYKGLWSEKSPVADVSVIPPAPVLSGPEMVGTPTVVVDVYSVAGLLRVYVDDREVYRGDVDSGLKHIQVPLTDEGTHTITADVEVYRVRSDMSSPLVVVYSRTDLMPPTMDIPSVVDEDVFDVEFQIVEGGVLHVFVDGVEVASREVGVGKQQIEVEMPEPHSIGDHTLTAYVERDGKRSVDVSSVFKRIPKMPDIQVEDRVPRGLVGLNVWVEVDGVLKLSTGGGGVHSYPVKAGWNSIEVPFVERGKVTISARLVMSDGCESRLATRDVFVYDKVEVWIDKKEYRINGRSGEMDVAPFIDPTVNRALVPLRFILEGLGYEVRWDGSARMVIITGEVYKDGGVTEQRRVYIHMPKTTAQMHGKYKVYPGSKMVRVEYGDGRVEEIDLTNFGGRNMGLPLIYENRTFVPVRFISEIFGARVLWYGDERRVEIQR